MKQGCGRCMLVCCVLFLTNFLLPVGGTAEPPADKFKPGCTLPYNAKAVHHSVDTTCGVTGKAPATKPASQEQNRLKNELCVDASAAVAISVATLQKLQTAVEADGTFKFGSDALLNTNQSRAALAKLQTVDADGNPVELGEGKVVVLEAFVLHAKHDDVPLLNPNFHGESVNCNKDSVAFNDIHIALGQNSSDKECASVTAEIIPHFRPASWNRFDNDPKTSPAVHGLPVKGLKVRITGQLFFDASHKPKPCDAPASSNPARASDWEIHPVYKVEVLDGATFISFDDFAKKH
jgi:hypothetical protein